MTISSVKLVNYRCHKELAIEADQAKFIIICGKNGVGKTNILEAISLFAPGKGFRNAKMAEIENVANQNTGWSTIILDQDDNKFTSIYSLSNTLKGRKRALKLNDNNITKQKDIVNHLRVIWLTPQMDGVFASSSSVRRKILDRITFNLIADHVDDLARMEFAMKSRLRLLIEGNYNNAWLKSIERSLIEAGLKVFHNRKLALEEITGALSTLETYFLKPELSMAGEFEEFLQKHCDAEKSEIIDLLHEKYSMMRQIDAKAKRTIFGPNRTDLHAIDQKKNMSAAYSSTGEQKSMIISLILGQIKNLNSTTNIRPIVLLDEIFSHLDNERVKLLIKEFEQLNAQFWITTTDFDLHKKFNSSLKNIILAEK